MNRAVSVFAFVCAFIVHGFETHARSEELARIPLLVQGYKVAAYATEKRDIKKSLHKALDAIALTTDLASARAGLVLVNQILDDAELRASGDRVVRLQAGTVLTILKAKVNLIDLAELVRFGANPAVKAAAAAETETILRALEMTDSLAMIAVLSESNARVQALKPVPPESGRQVVLPNDASNDFAPVPVVVPSATAPGQGSTDKPENESVWVDLDTLEALNKSRVPGSQTIQVAEILDRLHGYEYLSWRQQVRGADVLMEVLRKNVNPFDKDEDINLGPSIAAALGRMKAARWDTDLLKLLKTSPELLVRAGAALALGEIAAANREALGDLVLNEMVQVLEIPNEDAEVKTAAVNALGMLGDPRAVRPIAEYFQQGGHQRFTVDSIATAFGALADQATGSELRMMVDAIIQTAVRSNGDVDSDVLGYVNRFGARGIQGLIEKAMQVQSDPKGRGDTSDIDGVLLPLVQRSIRNGTITASDMQLLARYSESQKDPEALEQIAAMFEDVVSAAELGGFKGEALFNMITIFLRADTTDKRERISRQIQKIVRSLEMPLESSTVRALESIRSDVRLTTMSEACVRENILHPIEDALIRHAEFLRENPEDPALVALWRAALGSKTLQTVPTTDAELVPADKAESTVAAVREWGKQLSRDSILRTKTKALAK